MKGYAIATPLIVPPEYAPHKVLNVGDGFILDRIMGLLAPAQPTVVLASRRSPTEEELERINSSGALVLAGANQLQNRFTVFPGWTAKQLEKVTVPIVPFGIGLHGMPDQTDALTTEARDVLLAIHDRVPTSSWRCPSTLRFLLEQIPQLECKASMTGCPVMYDEPILSDELFSSRREHVVVTITERHRFWLRASRTLRFVASQFPNARRTLALHQDHRPPALEVVSAPRSWGLPVTAGYRRRHNAAALHALAVELGYEIFASEQYADYFDLYASADAHFGSRAHAHLYFLSQAKPSYLSSVDGRSQGFSEGFDFPLVNPREWSHALSYDFGRYRRRVQVTYPTMTRFVDTVKAMLS